MAWRLSSVLLPVHKGKKKKKKNLNDAQIPHQDKFGIEKFFSGNVVKDVQTAQQRR